MVNQDIWTAIRGLHEAWELFLDFPVPDDEAENADREEDERVISQQVAGAAALAQAALNVPTAHIFSLYGDPREGGTE